MPIVLPEECQRVRTDCSPLYKICSDDDGGAATFICIGLNDGTSRVHGGDVFRKCVRAAGVDTMEDCDRHDLLDEALVILQGLSIAENLFSAMSEGEKDDDEPKE